MRTTWIIKDSQNNLATVSANHKPVGAICLLPEGERVDWLEIQDIDDGHGGTYKQAVVNQTTKDSVLAAESAAAAQEASDKVANQYKLDRKAAYPPIGDQLDALYKKLHLNDSTDYDALAAEIAQVKLDFPKPE